MVRQILQDIAINHIARSLYGHLFVESKRGKTKTLLHIVSHYRHEVYIHMVMAWRWFETLSIRTFQRVLIICLNSNGSWGIGTHCQYHPHGTLWKILWFLGMSATTIYICMYVSPLYFCFIAAAASRYFLNCNETCICDLWMFPKIVVQCPQIIHFNGVFHYKPSILRYPYFLETPKNPGNPGGFACHKTATAVGTPTTRAECLDLDSSQGHIPGLRWKNIHETGIN